MMATKKITVPAGNFSLRSVWKCRVDTKTAGRYGYKTFVFASGPSLSEQTIPFQYSLPSGAKILSATIHASISKIQTGYSVLNVNGNALRSGNAASVTLSGTNGTYQATFRFRANGNLQDTDEHTAWANFSNVYLEIEYDDEAVQTQENNQSTGGPGFHIPPQKVAIYNQDTGAIYMFDGVEKIQHSFTLKIEEEPSNKKKEYVNNALNEPDKVVLDVIMSDVYSDSGSLTVASGWEEAMQQTAYNAAKKSIDANENGVWSRSENAVRVLRALKEARTLVSVITPQYVHWDMLIETITVNQGSETPFGWTGQIAFKHKPVAQKKKANPKKAEPEGPSVPTEGTLFTTVGELVKSNSGKP